MDAILVDMLEDWVRYEMEHGERYDSSIWTNIVFRLEGLNETLSKRIGKEVDVIHYLNICPDDFFNDPACTYWWKKFPAKAVIIIDEVHFYLGKKVEFGSLDMEQELINWISTHRHTQQLIYFLSQHTDQFARQVLGIADELLEIVNIKSLTLPWPISVPMADVEELKRSFGITTQYYQANVGNFRGKAIRWSGAVHRHMMTADIFRVYRSHDTAEASDRPSLKMTKWRGLLWFLRRHGWHLLPKMAGILLLPYVASKVLFAIPDILMNAAMATGEPDVSSKPNVPAVVEMVEDVPEVVKPLVKVEKSERIVVENTAKAVPEATKPPVKMEQTERMITESTAETVPVVTKTAPALSKKVVMLYQNGVILNDGSKITIGEAFTYEGASETLACACAICGVIVFESGKRVRF